MKKSFFPFVSFSFFVATLLSQSGQFVQAPIIVQSGNTAKSTSTLDSALLLAADGDLIYLPGGSFYIGNPINKKVHIYGAGWRSDSSAATGATSIYPFITLNAGASGGSLNGVYVQGNVRNFNGQNLSSYFISRCRTMWIDFENIQSPQLNCTIQSSVIRYVNFYSGTLNFTNSILEERFYCANNSALMIDRCVLLHNTAATLFHNIATLTLSNSIVFQQVSFGSGVSFYDFHNSLFVGNIAGLPPGLNGYNNNIVKDQSFSPSVFVNYPGAQFFQEMHDFHTQPGCAECAGKGIYAGPTPYKDVPENPYVTARAVSISPDGQSLQLNFTVNKGAN